jgi:hypothetical protein
MTCLTDIRLRRLVHPPRKFETGTEAILMRLSWNALLFGLKATRLAGDIYSVKVSILGESEIGPYEDLLRFVKLPGRYRLPVEVHHIVNGEHLAGTGWPYAIAPCIVLSQSMHQQYHGRFSETITEYHPRDIIGSISHQHALQLYHDMFVEQTRWNELWTIAARILTAKTRVPTVQQIWKGEE